MSGTVPNIISYGDAMFGLDTVGNNESRYDAVKINSAIACSGK